MRKLFSKIALVFASTLLIANTALATEVGVFNMQEITSSSDIAKAAEKELSSTFGKETAALDKQAKDLQAKIAEFQKQAPALSEKARAEKAQALDKDGRAFEEKRIALANKINPRQQAMQAEIIEVIRVASENFAKEEGYDLIIDGTTTVVAALGKADVTDEVIDEMNKVWKSRGSKFKK